MQVTPQELGTPATKAQEENSSTSKTLRDRQLAALATDRRSENLVC